MPDLFGKASDWLQEQRHTHLTKPVLYKRGEDDPIEVQATIGRTQFDQATDHGAIARIETRDFLVRVEDLPSKPAKGDHIIEGGMLYVVVAEAGMPPWSYSDENRKTYRIRTKERGAAE